MQMHTDRPTPGKIVSHFLPQDGRAIYFAFSTVVGDKPLTTAILLTAEEGAAWLQISGNPGARRT